MRLPVLTLLLLAGCPMPDVPEGKDDSGDTPTPGTTGGDDTDDSGVDTDTRRDTGGPDDTGWTHGDCWITVDATTPTNGAIDAYSRADVIFYLSDPDPTATIETDIVGHLEVEDDVVRWALDEPMEPDTDYEVTLHYCGGDPVLSFRTSELGEPLADSLEGRTWAMDLSDATFVEPEGIGAVLASYMTATRLFGVTSQSASELGMITTFADPDAGTLQQDDCVTPETFTADFDDPDVEAGGLTFTSTSDLFGAGTDVPMEDVSLAGTFAPDGSYAQGTLSSLVDTRPLAPLLDESGDEGAICDLAVSFGATCEACADGAPYCLRFVVEDLLAEEVTGLEIDPAPVCPE